jgi:hypothetical protein
VRGLTKAERLVVVGVAFFHATMFFTWFEAIPTSTTIRDQYGSVGTLTGWDIAVVYGPLPAALLLLLVVTVIVRSCAPTRVPDGWDLDVIARVLGIVAALLVITEAIRGESIGSFDSLVRFDVRRTINVPIAAAASVIAAAGSVLLGRDRHQRRVPK